MARFDSRVATHLPVSLTRSCNKWLKLVAEYEFVFIVFWEILKLVSQTLNTLINGIGIPTGRRWNQIETKMKRVRHSFKKCKVDDDERCCDLSINLAMNLH